MLAYCVYVLKVASIDGPMPFLVACHCTVLIVNLLFVICTWQINFFSLSLSLSVVVEQRTSWKDKAPRCLTNHLNVKRLYSTGYVLALTLGLGLAL